MQLYYVKFWSVLYKYYGLESVIKKVQQTNLEPERKQSNSKYYFIGKNGQDTLMHYVSNSTRIKGICNF